jgi:hypothetical protein
MKSILENDQRHWLDDHVARWVGAGIVSPDQGRAIVRLETGESAPPQPAFRRLSIGSEAIAYCGSALALMGGAFVVARSWEAMPVAARVMVGLVVAAVGFVGGRTLHAMHEPGADRLGGFLWLVGAGGVALTTGVSVHQAGVDTPELIAMSIGAVVLLVGALLWRNLERPLQLLTTVVGLMVVAISSVSQLDLRPWVGGIALWIAAFAVGAFAAGGRVHPQLFALMLAALGLLAASATLADLSEGVSAPVGLASAAGIVVAALALHRTPVLVLGVLGMLLFLQGLFALYFSGPLASAAVALVGLVVVAVVLVRSTRQRREG